MVVAVIAETSSNNIMKIWFRIQENYFSNTIDGKADVSLKALKMFFTRLFIEYPFEIFVWLTYIITKSIFEYFVFSYGDVPGWPSYKAGMPDVTRSDSQRSDASLRPRVSFNRDVHVKRIGTNTKHTICACWPLSVSHSLQNNKRLTHFCNSSR